MVESCTAGVFEEESLLFVLTFLILFYITLKIRFGTFLVGYSWWKRGFFDHVR